MLMPAIKEYNGSKSTQKEDAAFRLYLQLLRLPRLGLPKAGFAAQLIIGRFGCIDSINSNILELPKDIVGPDNKFKSPGKSKVQSSDFVGDLTKGGVEMAKKYADYLNHLEETINDDISKILWDNWCDIVAHKIKNPRSQFDVELQGGLKGGRVESDYPRKYKPSNPSSEFMKKYGSDITGQEVSKQHHPAYLRAALAERRNKIALALKKKFVKETSVAANVGGYSGKADAYPAKPFDLYDLEEGSNVGAIEGGATKFAFKNTKQMQEPRHPLKGKPLQEKVKIKRKIKEEITPATDKKNFTANYGGPTGDVHPFDNEEEVIMEYLTEEQAKKKNPPLGKVTRNPAGSKKKFHVYVKCGGRVKKISFGDPNLSIKRDSPERRKSFRARHKCDKPEGKNRCTARYWSCYQWRAGKKVQGE
jgi:hypothetical protein